MTLYLDLGGLVLNGREKGSYIPSSTRPDIIKGEPSTQRRGVGGFFEKSEPGAFDEDEKISVQRSSGRGGLGRKLFTASGSLGFLT